MLIVREVVTMQFVSKALRLFNSQGSGKFVVVQQSVLRTSPTFSRKKRWLAIFLCAPDR